MENFDFSHFLEEQRMFFDPALREIRQGKKKTHWMWFIFPQLSGLGKSFNAEKFAIHNKKEAQAFLEHPILGQRLQDVTEALLIHKDKSAKEIFGYPDFLKLQSSTSLFALVSNTTDSVFDKVLLRYFNNKKCEYTLKNIN